MRNAAEALESLGRQIGFEKLSLNDAGACGLLIGEDTEIFFYGEPHGEILQITGVVGDLPPGDDALARRLLEWNADGAHNRPAAFAVDPVTSEILLTRQLPVDQMSAEQMLEVVEDFIARVEFWTDYLSWPETTDGSVPPALAPDEMVMRA